jgi:hypothetical protein
MKDSKDLGYLGSNFQIRLINQILRDKNFGESIISYLQPTYFDNQYFRLIIANIKNYFQKYGATPGLSTCEEFIRSSISDDSTIKYIDDIFREIRNQDDEDFQWIQDKSIKFCKQQEIKKAITEISGVIKNGDESKYDKIEDIFKKALDVGSDKEEGIEVFHSYDEVLRDDYREPIPTGISGLDDNMNGGLGRGELGLIICPLGVGKALKMDSKIYTPKGWVYNKDIQVGDEILGKDGRTQNVLGVYPQGLRPTYKVTFNDDTTCECDGEHLWSVNSLEQRSKRLRINKKLTWCPDYSYKTMTLNEIMKNIYSYGQLNYRIPVCEPVHFEDKEVKIDPYTLGIMLGDGHMGSSRITTSIYDKEIIDYISTKHDIILNNFESRKTVITTKVKWINSYIKELNLHDKLSHTKFIPDVYKYNSLEKRIELLQGIMDSDGTIDSRGIIEFSSSSRQLTEDVRELVLSLGGFCKGIRTKKTFYKKNGEKVHCKDSYRISMSFVGNIIPFKLKRKIERFKPREKYQYSKFFKKIEYIGEKECQCIKVSNPDELYLIDDFIVTHNTTFLTKVSNTAFNEGKNVVQIIFEDNPKAIQRKHYSCWTGIELNELGKNKDKVIDKLMEFKDRKNKLIIKKFPSYGVSTSTIKKYLTNLIKKGIKPDVVIIDYVECLIGDSYGGGEEWQGEGKIMRQIESMSNEMNFVCWVASQGGRSSISSDVITVDKMSGNIKKAQIGHFIISVAKSLKQKELGLGTMAILKSRFGRDGLIFKDCVFDNGRMIIDTTDCVSFMEFEEDEKEDKQIRANRARQILQQKKQLETV